MAFFGGRRRSIVRGLEMTMRAAAKVQRYEEAAAARNRLRALEHVQDIAVLKDENAALDEFINVFGRIEGYDISNISGTDAVGSLAVFIDGRPKKSEYRRFRIKTVAGANDTAMIAEVLGRRFARSTGRTGRRWPLPDLILVDGGTGQLNAARRILGRYRSAIPLVGLAKGPDRKRDELVYDKSDHELARLASAFKPLLQHLRDEAHRFAISYHRQRRSLRYRL
jgi:excinuclease ABC subunit C